MKSSILYVTMVLSGLITLFACVTVAPQAEVNIDATVEARVAKEISDTLPTSTPEIIATVVPNPEPTPTPNRALNRPLNQLRFLNQLLLQKRYSAGQIGL